MGLEPIVVPLLQREWDVAAILAAVAATPAPDLVLVTSSVTADILATAAPAAWLGARWAAVGPSTRRRLLELGLPCHHTPATATAHAMVASLGDLAGQTVVYPRADLAHPRTIEQLRQAGAEVHAPIAYRNVAPQGASERVRAALPVDATPLLSGSATRRLAEAVPEAERGGLGQIVAIGPSTAAVARAVGLQVARQASPHTLGGMLQALALALGQGSA